VLLLIYFRSIQTKKNNYCIIRLIFKATFENLETVWIQTGPAGRSAGGVFAAKRANSGAGWDGQARVGKAVNKEFLQ